MKGGITIGSRDVIFKEKALKVLGGISNYKAMYPSHISKLYGLDEKLTKRILSELKSQSRIVVQDEIVAINSHYLNKNSKIVFDCLDVLCEFADRLVYHTSAEYPVAISFFTDSNEYDIIPAPIGKEAEINAIYRMSPGSEGVKKLVLVEQVEQIEILHIPGVKAFCLVEPSGITYYKEGE